MLQRTRLLLLPSALRATCVVGGPLGAQDQQARATFANADDKPIGTAMLTQTHSGVLIDVTVNGVPPCARGFHIHETGTVTRPPSPRRATTITPQGPRTAMVPAAAPTGDLPNQFVQTDSMLRVHVRNPQVTLGAGKATLFDVDGSALVIHTQADDSTSQPAGEAGDRLAGAGILPR